MLRNVPLPNGSYSDDARTFAEQDVLGFIPTLAEQEGSRSSLMLRQLPGLREFAAFPNGSRMRGARNVEGRLLFVVDTNLCQLEANGSIANLGTIPGTGRVSISHNQILNGNEVLITTGTLGFIYNTVTADLDQITDTGFMGGLLADFIGARFVTLDPARRFFQNSELTQGLEWNSSEFYAGESSPDRIRSLKAINNELVLLNESSIEHFAYTGTTNALFENKGIVLDRGCAASHAVSVMDNALYFIGNDGSAYEKRGYEIQRISTHAIEQAWSREDLSKAFSMVWEDKGYKVWYVTFPNGLTWGFDASTRRWHRRSSYGMDRWRVAWLMPWGNGLERAWYAGDYNSGRIFRLEWDYPYEGAAILPRGFSPGVLAHDSNRVFLHTVRLDVEVGPTVEATAAQSLVLSGSLPDCAVGDTVSFQYTLAGGFSPASWEVSAGALPAGLALDPDTGLVAGTTTTAEHDNLWTITVTDANGDTVTLDDGCYVLNMLGDPPDALNGDNYSYTLTGEEGEPAYTFALVSGALPTGATLASDGEIAGMLTETGTFTFSVTMTDSEGVTQTKSYNIGVSISYGTIFVGTAAAGGMTIVDGDTGSTTNVSAATKITLPTVSNDGARVYYLDPLGQTLNYLQLSDNSLHVLTSSLPNNGSHPLIDSTGTYIWVLDFDNKLLRKVRLSDGVEVDTYTTTVECAFMCWKDSDKLVIYLSQYSGFGIGVFNTASPAAPTTLDPYGHAAGQGIGVDSSTGNIIRACDNGTNWSVDICTAAGVGVASISLALITKGLCVSADGSTAFVIADNVTPGSADGKVYVIDTASHVVTATITVDKIPNDIAVNAAGSRVYVPCAGDDSLVVIDPASLTVIDTIAVGDQASGVGILEG